MPRAARGFSQDAQLRHLQQLHRSALGGVVFDVYSLFESRRACIKALDKEGNNALHWAAQGRTDSVIALLLTEGCSTTVVNGSGKTPLHLAAEAGNARGFARMLDYLPPTPALTPTSLLQYVLEKAPAEAVPQLVVALLDKCDADPHALIGGGRTILDLAAERHPGCVKLLRGRREEVTPSADNH